MTTPTAIMAMGGLVLTRLMTIHAQSGGVFIVALGDGKSLEWAAKLSTWAYHVCVVERKGCAIPGRDESALQRPNVDLHVVDTDDETDVVRLCAAYVRANRSIIRATIRPMLVVSSAPLDDARCWRLVYPVHRFLSLIYATAKSHHRRPLSLDTDPLNDKPFPAAPLSMPSARGPGASGPTTLQVSSSIAFVGLGIVLMHWKHWVSGILSICLAVTSISVHHKSVPAVRNELIDKLDYAVILGLVASTIPAIVHAHRTSTFIVVPLLICLMIVLEFCRPRHTFLSPVRIMCHAAIHITAAITIGMIFYMARRSRAMTS